MVKINFHKKKKILEKNFKKKIIYIKRKNNYLEIDSNKITNICEIIKKIYKMLRLLVGTFQLIMNIIV